MPHEPLDLASLRPVGRLDLGLANPILRGRVLGRDVVTLHDAIRLVEPLAARSLNYSAARQAAEAIRANVSLHSCPHGELVLLDELSAKLSEIVARLRKRIRHVPYACLDGLAPRFEAVPYAYAPLMLGISMEELLVLLQRGLVFLAVATLPPFRYRAMRGPVQNYASHRTLVVVPRTLAAELKHSDGVQTNREAAERVQEVP